jgi:hypothetical protein
MQFPKTSLVIGALALGVAGSLCAADNPAQAAARTAMVQKLSELSAQQPPETNAVAAPKAAAAKPVKAKAKVRPATVVTPPAVAAAPTAPAAAPVVAAPTVAVVPAAPVVEPAKACPAGQVPAAEKTKAELKVPPAPAPKAEKSAAAAWYPGKETGLPPIAGPASPLTASQESRLQALLAKYKADQITSEQYQQQRATILAAP